MFYIITHQLHNDDIGALIEGDNREDALRILFNKGNFGDSSESFLLNVSEFDNIEEPLSQIKYNILINKRKGKRDNLIIQWCKAWGVRNLK
jgi:hypothetical protein